jgi:signal transduction histidine kinase
LYKWITSTTDSLLEKKFIYAGVDAKKMMEELSNRIGVEFDLTKINDEITNFLLETLGVSYYQIIILNNSQRKIVLEGKDLNKKIDEENLKLLVELWETIGSPQTVIQDEFEYSTQNSLGKERFKDFGIILEKNDIECLVSLNERAHIKGVLLLGSKEYSSGYKQEDLHLINNLVDVISTALSRSLLYSQVRNFNASLKRRVDEQTVELRTKVIELEQAQNKERDMIDIMGHELRTPASVVKMNVELLHAWKGKLNGEVGNVKTWDDFSKYMERISDSIENEISIINTLLTSAKLEGNRLELNKSHVDVLKAIGLSLEGHKKEILDKGLVVKFNENINIPKVFVDKGRFQEIVDNIIGNAVKYTHKGGIGITTSVNNGFVRISILDTGQGISKEDIKLLGKKFYRTNQYIKQDKGSVSPLVRPGGTGLGLYVVFGLIRAHGGDVNVVSELGKGSVFSFTVPIAYGEEVEEETIFGGNMFDKMRLKK